LITGVYESFNQTVKCGWQKIIYCKTWLEIYISMKASKTGFKPDFNNQNPVYTNPGITILILNDFICYVATI